jgi:hypothetical protein
MGKNINWRYLAFLPIIAVLIMNYLFLIEIPIYDYGDMLSDAYAHLNASLVTRLVDYWGPFVDHRHLFPRLTIDLLNRLTNNRHYALETALGFGFRLGLLYLIWVLIRKTDLSERNKTAAWLVSAFLIFWPLMQDIFLIQVYSTVFAWGLTPALLAIYLLHTFWGRWLGIGSAALASAVSCYSQGSGVSLWIAVGLGLLPQRGWSGKQKAVWWLISLMAIGLFLVGMPSRADNGFPPLRDILHIPLRAIKFFFQSFTPPLSFLLVQPYVQAAVGVAIVIFSVLPLLLLLRQKRLFTQTAFPWLTIIIWCLGISAMATLGRSTLMDPFPRPTYFMSQVLALIAPVPLWLALYPNLLPSSREGWLSLPGLLCLVSLVITSLVYMHSSWMAAYSAREFNSQVKWYRSCLRYYPAIEKPVFPDGSEGYINESYLPHFAEMNAFPEYLDATPFSIDVPTTFEIQDKNDLAISASSPEGIQDGTNQATSEAVPGPFQFLITGEDPYVSFKPSPEIHKRHVVSFTIETSAAADVEFSWTDGKAWFDSIPFTREEALTTTNYGCFPESRPDYHLWVTGIRLKFTKLKDPQTLVTIRNIQVLTR